MRYPEHDKLAKVADESQVCGEFLEWLDDKRIVLASYQEGAHYPQRVSLTIPTLLAEFFGIDQAALEREKRAMLSELGKQAALNEATARGWRDEVDEHYVVKGDPRAENAAGTFSSQAEMMDEIETLISVRGGYATVRAHYHFTEPLAHPSRVGKLASTGRPASVFVHVDKR